MKKLLLSFLSVIVSMSAFAGSYTVTFKDGGATTDKTAALTASSAIANVTESSYVSIIKATNNTYLAKENYGLKFSSSSKNGSITFALAASGVCKPTSIVVEAALYGTDKSSVAVNGATSQSVTSSDFTPFTFEFDGQTEITTLKIDAVKRIYVKSVTVNFAGDGEVVTAAPVIAVEGENTIVMTSSDGGSIYYTLDGTEPTEGSALYTTPISFTAKTTVKAIAVANGKASEVTTYTAIPNVVDNLADFVSNGNTSVTKVNAPVTAIYQNGRNLYLKDANDNFILAYNQNDLASVKDQFKNNGDVISYISGTYKLQAGLPELIVTEVGDKSTGDAVDPYEVNVSDIDATMLNQYVVFGPVSIVAASAANNYTATGDDGSTITLYNQFANANNYDVVTVPTGEDFLVTGFVSVYNSNLQVIPVLIEGGVVKEKVEAPVFSQESGSVASGTKITLTCATEGATIYYTTEDITPSSTNSFPYDDATGIVVTETMTIKAIAVKEGMIDSDVVSATYSIVAEGAVTATFDFHDDEALIEQCTSDLTLPESGKGNYIPDYTFVSGPVTLSLSAGTNTTNNPVWWNYAPSKVGTDRGPELRLYVGNTATFSVAAGYKIDKIVITQNEGSTTFGAQTVTCDGGEGTWTANDKTWVATSGSVTSVTFSADATSRYGKFAIECSPTSMGAIDSVISDADADAPVEYFNIQGVRVNADNLIPGIYVRRQGNSVNKVLVK